MGRALPPDQLPIFLLNSTEEVSMEFMEPVVRTFSISSINKPKGPGYGK
jgi:hypothetical protein